MLTGMEKLDEAKFYGSIIMSSPCVCVYVVQVLLWWCLVWCLSS